MTCIKLEGAKAERIKELHDSKEELQNEICGKLKAVMEEIKGDIEQAEKRYQTQINSVLEDTELEGSKIADLSFEMGYYSDHGIIFAREQKTPDLAEILNAIFSRSGDEMRANGVPSDFADKMAAFEIVEDENTQSAWNREPA